MTSLAERTIELTTDVGRPEPVVKVNRRMIDRVLVWLGTVVTIVLVVAGGLLMWGSSFAGDYVHDELAAQNITFGAADSLAGQGRQDLVKYAGQRVDTGDEAEAYASYIGGHVKDVAEGKTYAELGGPERAAAPPSRTRRPRERVRPRSPSSRKPPTRSRPSVTPSSGARCSVARCSTPTPGRRSVVSLASPPSLRGSPLRSWPGSSSSGSGTCASCTDNALKFRPAGTTNQQNTDLSRRTESVRRLSRV